MKVSYIQVLHLEELVIPMVEKSPSSADGCSNFNIPRQVSGKEIWDIYKDRKNLKDIFTKLVFIL
jgi:hypothetical protein